ncbi:hypothetical protein ALC57_18111 [Trachymyrmex cornetzi]|uniref:Uncharacterized protein n=1 Tax=Trachymyrmex cornetzi TaxID=471704 RepID=A0A151ISA2_9HYME|nr:hypothetical protein ALC57_18111 [Trachymyrmex cornetzi]
MYIAGYVAHRFRNTHSHLGVPTKTLPDLPTNWLSSISRGNCIYPSTDFLNATDIMNREFENFHGNFFNRESNIFDKLTDIVCTKLNNFPKNVIACLVRTRTYIRLREFNKKIVENNSLKKKANKMYRICNKKY